MFNIEYARYKIIINHYKCECNFYTINIDSIMPSTI